MEDKIKTQATGINYSTEIEQSKIMDVHGPSNNGSPIRQEWPTYTPHTGHPGDVAQAETGMLNFAQLYEE